MVEEASWINFLYISTEVAMAMTAVSPHMAINTWKLVDHHPTVRLDRSSLSLRTGTVFR